MEYVFNVSYQLSKCGRAGLTKIWHSCANWHAKVFPWHAAFTDLPLFLFLFPDLFLHTVKKMCMYVCVCVCGYVGVYLTAWRLYELLPNNSVSETLWHISRALFKFCLEIYYWDVGQEANERICDSGRNVLQFSFQTRFRSSPHLNPNFLPCRILRGGFY